jgi:hypothetical protein
LLRLFPSSDPTRVGASGTGSAHSILYCGSVIIDQGSQLRYLSLISWDDKNIYASILIITRPSFSIVNFTEKKMKRVKHYYDGINQILKL